MTKPEEGYLLIADITGYTSYLSRSELEHAQDTLTALLNLLIDHTRPPLVISRLAGDAVISYSLRDHSYQGQTFLELIEDTYVAFRRALELMVLNTTCSCNACKNLGALDLKFFLHYGSFGLQNLGGHQELIGSDVILIHRLLKNEITERTGISAYAVFTMAAVRQLGVDEAFASLVPHREEYPHLGVVEVLVLDLEPVWRTKRSSLRIPFPDENVNLAVSTEIRLPAEQVWDHLLQADDFNVLAGGTRTELSNPEPGRVAEGSVYRCYHGDEVFPQTVLEWRPFERIVVQLLAPVPSPETYILIEYRLARTAAGTTLTQSFARATGPEDGRALADAFVGGMGDVAQADLDRFKAHVEATVAERPPAPPGVGLGPEDLHAAVTGELEHIVGPSA